MDNPRDTDPHGPFEARYLAFLETITNLRPSLHRYCSRMTGSVMDGEDVVQDALFEAYRKLDQYDDSLTWRFVISRQASRLTNVLSKGTGLQTLHGYFYCLLDVTLCRTNSWRTLMTAVVPRAIAAFWKVNADPWRSLSGMYKFEMPPAARSPRTEE